MQATPTPTPTLSNATSPVQQTVDRARRFDDIGPAYRVVAEIPGLDQPYGVVVGPDDDHLFFSGGNGDASGVARLGASAGEVDWLGTVVDDPGQLSAVADGRVLVVGRGDSSIAVSPDDGASWTTVNQATGRFSSPEAVTAWRDLMAVTNTGNDTVSLSRDRGVTWEVVPSDVGGFHAPTGAVFDSTGTLVVANSGDGSIAIGSDGGTRWARVEGAAAGLRSPHSLAVGPHDELYVTDPTAGVLARSVDGGTTWEATPGFENAWGVAVDRDGQIFLTDDRDTVAALTAVPGPVTGMSARWSANGDLAVTWKPPVVDGGSPISMQRVAVIPLLPPAQLAAMFPEAADPLGSDDPGPATMPWLQEVSADADRITIPGLPPGLPVQVVAVAVNSLGAGTAADAEVGAR